MRLRDDEGVGVFPALQNLLKLDVLLEVSDPVNLRDEATFRRRWRGE